MNINENIKIKTKLELKKDFSPPSFDEWKKKVEADLKGASFEKKLITKTYEGIELYPIYTKKDINKLKLRNDFPGRKLFKRGLNFSGYINESWNINQEIKVADPKAFNKELKNALANGQNSINLTLDSATNSGLDADIADYKAVGDKGVSISTIDDLEKILNGIDIKKYPVIIDSGFNTLPLLSLIIAYAKKHDIKLKEISGIITSDPFLHLIENGELSVSLECIFDIIKHNIAWIKKKRLNLKLIGISSLPYNNFGANAVQELAFVMATVVEYANRLLDRKVKPQDIFKNMVITFGIGTNYFMEIAKFRAARVLLTNIAGAYGISGNPDILISAKTSTFYQSLFDPYVNMLRSTTETFSAILGGVNSITTDTFDNLFGNGNNFSRRIARNTQIILKEESHLNKIIDAGGGSYYIESITKALADNAWQLFKTIEKKGGMLNAIKNGFIQNSVNYIVEKRMADINKRKSVIVGTNMFANLNEEKIKPKKINQKRFQKKRTEYLQNIKKRIPKTDYKLLVDELRLAAASCSSKVIDAAVDAILNGITIGEVTKIIFSAGKNERIIIPKFNKIRAAEGFEELRNISLRIKNKTGSYPKIFLANMGSLKEYKARADFSRGFFEVGGFEVIYSKGFNDVKVAIKEAIKQKSNAIVICSTDENYKDLVPVFTEEMKKKRKQIPLILAGYPKDKVEGYKKLGIDKFIFLGADVYKILSELLSKVGGRK